MTFLLKRGKNCQSFDHVRSCLSTKINLPFSEFDITLETHNYSPLPQPGPEGGSLKGPFVKLATAPLKTILYSFIVRTSTTMATTGTDWKYSVEISLSSIKMFTSFQVIHIQAVSALNIPILFRNLLYQSIKKFAIQEIIT